ncbi:thioesterase family protein [Methanothermobacter wolfeii]|uniref:Acyl-CoA thioesterase n=1 Tax=Methanothermobacter wolfeii TaxID=145261 RepID=A0A9E7RRD4_METWO|nr:MULTISPECIES: thioesterase family protein [Methanothermobacter]MDI6701404.1 thioesterase family protein [Methanothermobacter wolfeii]MDI6842063.1 thioesterase family protein [Methanothermobacter wolfeii]NLM03125.1 acyl-CoA thioesterase [Methanothermobacter wolfeii]QHN06457.1 acyl-CoA thioesterase [Methanothermobacter sp. THM-1]UXH30956.1 acyl-CoA thioesterase [Methanothermobacter wolfeii]
MFKITVTPRFGDIDGLRHVNNTVLAVWFEKGRNPIFRMFTPDLDLSYEKWKLILVRTEFDFLAQMYYGSDVEIRSYITHIGNSSFTIGHEAWQDGELKARGRAVLVHYDFIEQKKKPIPPEIRAQLEEHLVEE